MLESTSPASRRASRGCYLFVLCFGAAFAGGVRWAYDLRTHQEFAPQVARKEVVERNAGGVTGGSSPDLPDESTQVEAMVKSQDLLPGEDHTPEEEAASVNRLAAYLKRGGKDDRERVGLIYRWITAHIAYDVEGFHRLAQNSRAEIKAEIKEDADAVLRARKGVCEGYANLFRALASEMEIKCEVIAGYGRGVGYRPGEHYDTLRNHAWNAVMLEGHWYLLDATWGAGHVDAEGTRFIRRFEPFYFLTPPEQFRYSHYPKEDRWQLCSSVLSQSEHERLPYLQPAFFQAGLELDSHPEAKIDTDGQVCIKLRAPDHVSLSATINRLTGGNPLPDKYAFVQREDGKLAVRALFPEKGDFLLRIFVDQEKRPLGEWAMDYHITCNRASTDSGFPTAFTPFTDHLSRLFAPLRGDLKPGEAVDFQLSVPGASAVSVTVNNNRHELTRTEGDSFHGTVNITPGKVVVWAIFNKGGRKEDALLEYSIDSR